MGIKLATGMSETSPAGFLSLVISRRGHFRLEEAAMGLRQ